MSSFAIGLALGPDDDLRLGLVSLPYGLPQPYPQIPRYLKFLYYLSFYQYVFSALVINHFGDLRFSDCSLLNFLCYHRGEDYLHLLGLAPDLLTRNLLVIVATLLLLILVGYVGLHRLSV